MTRLSHSSKAYTALSLLPPPRPRPAPAPLPSLPRPGPVIFPLPFGNLWRWRQSPSLSFNLHPQLRYPSPLRPKQAMVRGAYPSTKEAIEVDDGDVIMADYVDPVIALTAAMASLSVEDMDIEMEGHKPIQAFDVLSTPPSSLCPLQPMDEATPPVKSRCCRKDMPFKTLPFALVPSQSATPPPTFSPPPPYGAIVSAPPYPIIPADISRSQVGSLTNPRINPPCAPLPLLLTFPASGINPTTQVGYTPYMPCQPHIFPFPPLTKANPSPPSYDHRFYQSRLEWNTDIAERVKRARVEKEVARIREQALREFIMGRVPRDEREPDSFEQQCDDNLHSNKGTMKQLASVVSGAVSIAVNISTSIVTAATSAALFVPSALFG
ncbi:hypothetical protein H0H92_014335 [Tricholoma furcatifolium]|nr:hypothetical protein H0H92_014335 [Tricholoma furcatifolium]